MYLHVMGVLIKLDHGRTQHSEEIEDTVSHLHSDAGEMEIENESKMIPLREAGTRFSCNIHFVNLET